MKKLILILVFSSFVLSLPAQSPIDSLQNIQLDSLNVQINQLKGNFLIKYGWGSLATVLLALLGFLWWMYNKKIPALVQEELKSKIKEEMDDNKKMFDKYRLGLIGQQEKDSALNTFLIKNGFNPANLKSHKLIEGLTIDLNSVDILILNDLNGELSIEQIADILSKYGEQKIFYLGEKTLPNDLFKKIMKPAAQSMETFISNFLKAIK